MKIILIAAAIFVAIVSVINAERASEALLFEAPLTSSSTPASSAAPSMTPVPTATPTSTFTPSPTPLPSGSASNKNSNNFSDWVYPGSVVISQDGELMMNSSDPTDKITDWYKTKISSNGYSTRNFVKTSANDVVKNVIQAVDARESVSVEITKGPEDRNVKIEVEVKSL